MAKNKIVENDIALKPCPFCGCKLVRKEEFWRNKVTGISRMYSIYSHPQRECVLDYKRFHFYAEPWKVEAWNRRAEDGK